MVFALACAVAMTLAVGALPAQDSRTAAQHRERGVSLMTSGDSAAALAAFRAAVALDPADAVAHDAIGVLLADGGDLSAAIASFRESIRLDPGLAAAHFHLALALERTGPRMTRSPRTPARCAYGPTSSKPGMG